MKTDRYFLLIAFFLLAAGIAWYFSQCNGARTGTDRKGVSESTETTLKKGKPDTTSTMKPVEGTTTLIRQPAVNRRADFIQPETGDTSSLIVYQGVIKDSLIDIQITAREDSSGNIKLDYTGGVRETIIRELDSLISKTTRIEMMETPWYATAYAGAAYVVALVISLFIIFH